MTLAIGFGRDAAAATSAASGSLAAASTARKRRSTRAGRRTARSSRRRRSRSPRTLDAAPLPALRAGARRPGGQDLPRRLDRLAEHAVDLGHADARAGPPVLRSVPPRVAARPLPRVDRAEGRRRRRRRRRSVAYLWQVQRDDGAWWQNTRVNGTKKWETVQMRPGSAADRACDGGSARRARATGARAEGGRLPRRQRPAHAQRALGEPGRLLAETRSRRRSPA